MKLFECRFFSKQNSRKIPKTLSGIETHLLHLFAGIFYAGKYLKPYQGLKRDYNEIGYNGCFAGKHLKPYQGLKLFIGLPTMPVRTAGKHLKPYQGLKRCHLVVLISIPETPENT